MYQFINHLIKPDTTNIYYNTLGLFYCYIVILLQCYINSMGSR